MLSLDQRSTTFRRATSVDARIVADIAERTFRATFGQHNTRDDMDSLCRSAYGESIQKAEIEASDRETWLLESEGNAVGYFSFAERHRPAVSLARPRLNYFVFIWIQHSRARATDAD